MRIVFFHNIVAPYRHSLFEELSKQVELEVWYSTLKTKDRKWSTTIPSTYRSRVLGSIIIYLFNRPLILCPFLTQKISISKIDAVISVFTRSNLFDIYLLARYCKKRKIPLILFIGDVEDNAYCDEVPSFVSKIFNHVKGRILSLADAYIYYSNLSREWAESRGASGPFVTGTQVLEGNQTPRVAIDTRKKQVVGLFVGKMEPRKGVDLFPSVLSQIAVNVRQQLHLKFIGSGPNCSVVDAIRLLGVSTEHIEDLPRELLWDEYRNADFLIVPSRHDPWAFVVNEAMSVGTPVLISKQAGAAELAESAGWVFDVRIESSFVSVLSKAILECRDELRRKRAVASEALYRPKLVADKITALLNKILNP